MMDDDWRPKTTVHYTLFYRDIKWMVDHGLATDVDLLLGRRYDRTIPYIFSDQGEIDMPARLDEETGILTPSIQDVGIDKLFERYNADDRPNAKTAPSMSVGDVVVVGEQAYFVAADDIETSRSTSYPKIQMPLHLIMQKKES